YSAKDEIGIGFGWLGPAFVVTGRPGIGTCTLGAVPERPSFVDPSQTSPSGADRQDFNAWKTDGITVFDVPVLSNPQISPVHQGYVRACPAHVQPDGILKTAQICDVFACDRSGGDAGTGQSGRIARNGLRRHDSAPGMKHQNNALVTLLFHLVFHRLDVATHLRAQDRI